MTRQEFVKAWADHIDEGRRANFPDITPAEIATMRPYDEEAALRHWRRYRKFFTAMKLAEFPAWMKGGKA